MHCVKVKQFSFKLLQQPLFCQLPSQPPLPKPHYLQHHFTLTAYNNCERKQDTNNSRKTFKMIYFEIQKPTKKM